MVGVQSAFITVPVNIILVALFKSIRTKEPINDAIIKPDIEHGNTDDESDTESDVFNGELVIFRVQRSLFKCEKCSSCSYIHCDEV